MSFDRSIIPSRRLDISGIVQTRGVVLTRLLTSSFRILKGNIAPGGAVAKITGKEGLGFVGKARTFDSEDDFVKAVETGSIKKGEKTVAILRYLGPQGGPGEFFFTICAICPTTTCLIFLVPKHWNLLKFIFVIIVFPPFQDHLSYLLPSYVFL